jgi:hypothetical protein
VANLRLDQTTPTSNTNAADFIPIIQGGITKYVAISNVNAGQLAAISNYTLTSTTAAISAGLQTQISNISSPNLNEYALQTTVAAVSAGLNSSITSIQWNYTLNTTTAVISAGLIRNINNIPSLNNNFTILGTGSVVVIPSVNSIIISGGGSGGGGTTIHNLLTGLQGGNVGNSEYYHLDAGTYANYIGRTEVAGISAGLATTVVTSAGLSNYLMPGSEGWTNESSIGGYNSEYITDRRFGVIPNSTKQIAVEGDLKVGVRNNLWQYTENINSNRYVAGSSTIGTNTIVIDGITLTKWSSSNFYGSIRSQIAGLGLTPFVPGQRYLASYYAISSKEVEQFILTRSLNNGNSNAHGAKLLTTNMRRIWTLVQATSNNNVTVVTTPISGLGTEAGTDIYWAFTANTEGGSINAYIGGFQIEAVDNPNYIDGIAMIGDSTMAGGSGGNDKTDTTAREVSTYLGAFLNVNVFNRGVGGNTTAMMLARWVTDITPLKNNCKYVIIQGGINDIVQGVPLSTIQANISGMVNYANNDGLIPVIYQ